MTAASDALDRFHIRVAVKLKNGEPLTPLEVAIRWTDASRQVDMAAEAALEWERREAVIEAAMGEYTHLMKKYGGIRLALVYCEANDGFPEALMVACHALAEEGRE